MKQILSAWLMAFVLGFAGLAGAGDRQKVVYHINGDDPKQQMSALGNIKNHINALGAENLDIKVVMNGDGLSLLLFPDMRADTKMKAANGTEAMQVKVAGLKQQGVDFQVCNNTLKGRNIPLDSLYDVAEADVIPSGVAQLAILQAQGYAYIKP